MHSEKKAGLLIGWIFLLMLLVIPFMGVRAEAGTTNMIAYANSKGTPAGKLFFTVKGVRYKYAGGNYAKNTWIKVGSDYYCFNKNGYALDGWFEYSGNTYYATSKGKIYHQSWHKEGSSKFYLKANGVLAKAQWVVTGGKVYIVDKTGRMITNKYFRVGDKYYYVNKNGQRVENAWVTLNGKKYFFNANGERLSSIWIKYNNRLYYVKADGSMAVNENVGKYHVGKDGVLDGYRIKYLFVGDSRTVGMKNSLYDSNSAFICKVGEGYNWLVSSADGQVKKYLKEYPSLKVIFNFGVNDLGNVNKYINYYSGLIKAYPKAKIYLLSVNPMVEAKWSNTSPTRASVISTRRYTPLLRAVISTRSLTCARKAILQRMVFTTMQPHIRRSSSM